jgi:succinate dehydrogenase/fumarate reductase flavoprotein subunit
MKDDIEFVNWDHLKWPYPIAYGKEQDIDADVLILGGGLAGCWAAISAARTGLKVALVEKGCTIHSGSAGAGIDHWQDAATNPASKVTPDELAQAIIDAREGYVCGISRYIKCRESYDRLLELEKMGMKIRDSEDEFKGADFRDEQTKFLFAYNYRDKHVIRIWGTGMKPALYRECKRLGVSVYDRVMATSLLTEQGKQGGRVVGATGVNVRTGEFTVFKAKATVLSMAGAARMWQYAENLGTSSHRPPVISGDGFAMAWKAGARLTLMEESQLGTRAGLGQTIPNSFASWYPCTFVDSKGKEIPWFDRDGKVVPTVSQRCYPAPGQKFFLGGGFVQPSREFGGPQLMSEGELQDRISKGDFVLPLYADLPSMPKHERRVIFGLMVGQEGLTWLGYRILCQAGFDPDKDLLQVYQQDNTPGVRSTTIHGGGLVVDWDLKTNLEGLYAAGEQVFCTWGAAGSSTTGHYAGRKASEYAMLTREPIVDRKQVEDEKQRVYAPVKRKSGIEWKELENGIAKVMQDYCGDVKNEECLRIGMKWLTELSESEAKTLYACNPHDLMRSLEALNILTVGQIILHACLVRKASSKWLGFERSDYPLVDPPEWHKFITTQLEKGQVKVGELPMDYGRPLAENYAKYNRPKGRISWKKKKRASGRE